MKSSNNTNNYVNNNNINKPNNIQKENKFILYKSIRLLVYFLLLLSIILINISSGLFPSASIDIKTHLQISDYQFGLFFLYSSIGKIVSSLLFLKIKKFNNRKIFLTLISLINSIIVFIFYYSKSFPLFSFLKFLMGINDMLIQIFVPIWIQQFGINKYKLTLTSITQLSNPLGKILAFWANFYFSWLFIFKIEGIILSLITFSFLLIPNKYTSKNILIIIENETGEEMYDKRTEKNVAIYTISEDIEDESNRALPLIDKSNNNNNDTVVEKELNVNLNINELIKTNGNKKIVHITKVPFLDKLKIIVNNKIFMISLSIRTILIGIQTSISLWIPDIIIRIIEIKQNSSLNLFGNILVIITPPLGSFITRMMGPFTITRNKRKRNTVVLLIFFYTSSILISILIPESKSFTFVSTLIVFLLCSATCLPMLHGICLSSVNQKVKEKIFSFIHIFTLFFGAGLMPFIFGICYEKRKNKKILVVKYFLNSTLGIGFVLLLVLIYLIYKIDFTDNRSSISSKGFSIELNSKNGGEEIVEQLGNAFGEELPDNVKKSKKTKLKSIDI